MCIFFLDFLHGADSLISHRVMNFFPWLILLHLASTLYMVGLIWFVQVVHYPLHASVGPDSFAMYQKQHMQLTSYVVGPPMLIEAITTAILFAYAPPQFPSWALILGAVLLGCVWLSTAVFQVPLHNQLLSQFNISAHHGLVSTNWIRTLMWSARGILVLWLTSLLIKM